jgi:hypothetical protein
MRDNWTEHCDTIDVQIPLRNTHLLHLACDTLTGTTCIRASAGEKKSKAKRANNEEEDSHDPNPKASRRAGYAWIAPWSKCRCSAVSLGQLW